MGIREGITGVVSVGGMEVLHAGKKREELLF
jgi:hypothetical protein